ncbi:MAG TPA: carbohydrate ABC transporter permease [Acidimicrobiia bacterium]|nr:carbohydrate ABC transporter permease [Acidimicrobiia bacterium]
MLDVTHPRTAPNHRLRRTVGRGLLYIVALGVLAVIIVPLAFAVLGGFSTTGQLVVDPVSLPDPWVTSNYLETLGSASFWKQMGNSAFIALVTILLVLPASSLAAFVIARFKFRGRNAVYALFTLGLLFPVAVAILPLFIVLRQTGLLDNPLGVALPQAAFALPLSIVIIRPFFQGIPRDLEDAASLDGCGPLRFYWSVMLPLSRPVMSTVAVLAIVTSWNAFLLPLHVLIRAEQWTLPIGVNNISAQYSTDTALVLAYTTLAMLPAILFYVIAERQIVRGILPKGALKG